MKKILSLGQSLLGASLLALAPDLIADEVAPLALASEGKPLASIVISPHVEKRTQELAGELADALRRITGAEFLIEEQAAPLGVVIGTETDWPGHLPPVEEGISESHAREDYLIRTTPDALFLIGRTPLAVQNALWDFLHELGFRQFFPGQHWEIWPRTPDLKVQIHRFEKPSYYFRALTTLNWAKNEAAFLQWKVRNRMVSGFHLRTGHAYDAIIARNKEYFQANPGAIHENAKFDPTWPGLADLVMQDSIRLLEQGNDSVSLDPSDGGGWREDSPLGGPSNQAITLANHVAAAIQERFPGCKVGLYGYHEHSPPPEIEVDPNVIVSIASSFIKGGYSVEELVRGWKARGAAIGIRDYLGVWSWSKDQPGRALAGDPDYLFRTIPGFWKKGARYWRSEGTPSWGANGLGYYIAARLLWNVDEAERRSELLADFYSRSFGAAASQMQRYFEECLFASAKPLVSEDLIGRMYRHLDAALQHAGSEEEKNRIRDFIVYTRYVELSLSATRATGDEKQKILRDLARFAWRTRDTGMLSGRMIFRDYRKPNEVIEPISALAPEKEHPLKDSEKVTVEMLDNILAEGIAANPPLGFQPVSFSKNLQPFSDSEKSPATPPAPLLLNGKNHFYLYADAAGKRFRFEAKVVSIYSGRGPVKLRLYADENPLIDQPVATAELPPDKEKHSAELVSPHAGLHRLEVDSPGSTEFSWPAGQTLAIPSGPEESVIFTRNAQQSFYFYVPEGTKVLGGYSPRASGGILDADGRLVFNFTTLGGPGYFSIPVPPEAAGSWWRLLEIREQPLLLTVPPYLARSPKEGMLPAETSPPSP